MARKDALLRLHKRLVAQRDDLRSKLSGDLNLGGDRGTRGPGDIGDEAHDGACNELNSRIASLESRELAMVERALKSLRDGTYGKCEACGKSIPVARLQALPYTTLCVECQRQRELNGGFDEDTDADWESAFEFEGRMSDRELTLRDIDVD